MKKFAIALLFVVLFTPSVSSAAINQTQRSALLAQIVVLQKEVARLQVLLAKVNGSSPSVFYPSTSEVRYKVEDGELTRSTKAVPVPTHQALFDQVTNLLGESVIDTYISEFRVGHVRDTSLENYIEGYIEFLPKENKWLLTVRRDGTKPFNKGERELFEELYIHEYAHLLAYYEEDFTDVFTARFWNEQTKQASAKVNRLYERGGYGALEEVHYDYDDRFVSGYAMLSPDEDIAESFVQFVENPYPRGTETVDEKVRFFYTNPVMVNARTAILKNRGN